MLLVLFVFNVMFRVIVLAIVLVLVLLPVPVLVQQPGIFVFFPGSLSCLYNLFYTSSLSMCCMGCQIFYLERISTCIAGVYLLADCNVEGGKCSNCTLALLELYDDPPSSPSQNCNLIYFTFIHLTTCFEDEPPVHVVVLGKQTKLFNKQRMEISFEGQEINNFVSKKTIWGFSSISSSIDSTILCN